MKKRGHFIFGLILALVFILFLGYFKLDYLTFNFKSIVLIIFLTLFYSILPDIDHKSGTMTWWFIGLSILGMIFGLSELIFNFGKPVFTMIISILFLIFTFIATNFFKHRGFIHSVMAGLVLALPVFFIFGNWGYFLIAYVSWHSHLIADGYFFKLV